MTILGYNDDNLKVFRGSFITGVDNMLIYMFTTKQGSEGGAKLVGETSQIKNKRNNRLLGK